MKDILKKHINSIILMLFVAFLFLSYMLPGLSHLIAGIFIVSLILTGYFKHLTWEAISNYLIMFFILLFLFSHFPTKLMLSETITTGGDTASHYYTAQYLKDYLLTKGKVSGWCPGNYGGFPMLQYYFFLPFLMMALLSYIIPLQISFKLITVLGTFLLPICAFFSMKLMDFKFPLPITAAIFTLPFLFMEANSMWGGNIPSTLAGEFTYSLSLSLTVLFFGSIYRGLKLRKYWIPNSILLMLIAFTHVYTLLFAVFSSAFLLFTSDKKEFISRFKYLFQTYLLSFLLLGFWIIPLITKLSYTTSYDLVWIIHHIEEVFPWSLVPFIALAGIGVFRCIQRQDQRIGFFYFSLFIAAVFYLVARYIGVVDIRFIPFIQLYLVLCGAYGFTWLVSRLKAKELIPLIVLLLVIFWVNNTKFIVEKSTPYTSSILEGEYDGFGLWMDEWSKVIIPELMKNKYHGFIPHWVKWNYEGFEEKGTWNEFHEINSFLKGSFNDPRVVYEHSQIHNKFGSSRAFESLALFAGRATLEGLYMQSSVSAPFIFYIQSEVSKEHSCPFYMNWPCTHFNMENGTEHMKLFNVKHFIAISDKAKKALDKNKEYRMVKKAGSYQVYELTTNENKYVIVPRYQPVLFKTNKWKNISYSWFRNLDLIDTPLVFVKEFSQDDLKRFKSSTERLDGIVKTPTEVDCSVEEEILNEVIRIKTSCPGMPHIIRVSYHPNWKVEGADKVYLASPSFMLIFPENEEVRLYYGNTSSDGLGILLSITGFLILLFLSYNTLSENQSLRRFLKR
ncbi:MAG: 6-pyruvoyl-tetrahydropterin synthase-related protein [Candidatus Altiarchaeota archaeon]|nr:6-pyruvoyl-tetrahydropterin synthase-related protein [Candidatus Altiarchaeota archaeon]